MDRKADAMMEFIHTYGWAILAAIIAIGVLGYFGVFSDNGRSMGESPQPPSDFCQGNEMNYTYNNGAIRDFCYNETSLREIIYLDHHWRFVG